MLLVSLGAWPFPADTKQCRAELLAVLVVQEKICQFGTAQSLDPHSVRAVWLLMTGLRRPFNYLHHRRTNGGVLFQPATVTGHAPIRRYLLDRDTACERVAYSSLPGRAMRIDDLPRRPAGKSAAICPIASLSD